MPARRRPVLISRLTIAWLALGSVLLGLAVFALLAPAPPGEEPAAVFDLTVEAERYAASAAFDLAENDRPFEIGPDAPPLEPYAGVEAPIEGGEGDPLAPSIEDALAEAGSGAVVITIPESTPMVRKGSESDAADRSGLAARPPQPFDPAYAQQGTDGLHPARAADGSRPYDRYRRVEQTSPERARLAIMVSGLGLDRTATAEALEKLPPSVSLSFAPYTRDLDAVVAEAMAKGHEVAVEVPMEAAFVDARAIGPAALSTQHNAEGNAKRLEWILARAKAYPMVTNYLGQTFAADPDAMRPVLLRLREAGLGVIDDTGLIADGAAATGIPAAAADLLIPPGDPALAQKMDALAARAVPGGPPVLAKVYAGEGGLNALVEWIRSSAQSGVVIVPASMAVETEAG